MLRPLRRVAPLRVLNASASSRRLRFFGLADPSARARGCLGRGPRPLQRLGRRSAAFPATLHAGAGRRAMGQLERVLLPLLLRLLRSFDDSAFALFRDHSLSAHEGNVRTRGAEEKRAARPRCGTPGARADGDCRATQPRHTFWQPVWELPMWKILALAVACFGLPALAQTTTTVTSQPQQPAEQPPPPTTTTTTQPQPQPPTSSTQVVVNPSDPGYAPPPPRTTVRSDEDVGGVTTVPSGRSAVAVIATDALYGGVGGALIGAGVTLIDQGNNWARNLMLGAGIGVLAGAGYMECTRPRRSLPRGGPSQTGITRPRTAVSLSPRLQGNSEAARASSAVRRGTPTCSTARAPHQAPMRAAASSGRPRERPTASPARKQSPAPVGSLSRAG